MFGPLTEDEKPQPSKNNESNEPKGQLLTSENIKSVPHPERIHHGLPRFIKRIQKNLTKV